MEDSICNPAIAFMDSVVQDGVDISIGARKRLSLERNTVLDMTPTDLTEQSRSGRASVTSPTSPRSGGFQKINIIAVQQTKVPPLSAFPLFTNSLPVSSRHEDCSLPVAGNQDKNGCVPVAGEEEEIKKLQEIDSAISAIRRQHSELIKESTDRRKQDQVMVVSETMKLERLEVQHRETGQLLKNASSGSDEQKQYMVKYRREQEDLETHRRLLDDLEFQLLEAEAKYEEQKEMIQQQLLTEQKHLSDVFNKHEVKPTKEGMGTNLTSTACDPAYTKSLESTCMNGRNNEEFIDQIKSQMRSQMSPSSYDCRLASPSSYNGRLASTSSLDDRLVDTFAKTAKMRLAYLEENGNEILEVERRRLQELRQKAVQEGQNEWLRRSPSPSRQFDETRITDSLLTPRSPICQGQGHSGLSTPSNNVFHSDSFETPERIRMLTVPGTTSTPTGASSKIQSSYVNYSLNSSVLSAQNINSDSEESSSIASSERQSEKDLNVSSEEKVLQLDRLLTAAEAEKELLLQQQLKQSAELRLERAKRLQVEKQLQEERSKRSQLIDEKIKYRDKQATIESRPLTRYLPVRDKSLDLRQFIENAGHNVDQCTDIDITVTTARGFLTKMGGRIKTWKRRWFVFDRTKHQVAYFTDRMETKLRGCVYFQTISDVFVDHLHAVKSPNSKLTFCLKTTSRTYYMVAPSSEARQIWIEVLFTGAEGYQTFV